MGDTARGWLVRLERGGPLAVIATCLPLMAVVGLIDYVTGPDVSFSIFYLIPAAVAGWAGGRSLGLIVSSVGGIVWLLADLGTGSDYSSLLIPAWNAGSRFGILAIFSLLLSTLKTALEHERQLARSDPLTGLANPRAFFEAATTELTRARRFQRPLSIAYIDVDDFKNVNDDFGHAAGDDLLRRIAEALVADTRHTDVAARIGGDEFVLLLPETSPDDAENALVRLQRRLEDLVTAVPYDVGFSVGAVTFLEVPDTVDEMVWVADQAMYTVKRTGKNRLSLKVLGKTKAES